MTIKLPIRAADVLSGAYKAGLRDEITFGNGDLIRSLEALGIAGPFKTVTPWELEDIQGKHKINAGGYAAIPFGDQYPPLIEFLQGFLAQDRSIGLSQQSANNWRAALETNLVALLAHFAPSHKDSRVFFSNSGAEAIETALKFVKAARPKAKEIINFKGAYHGKTFGALAVTPNNEYQELFRPLMPNITTLPYGDLDALSSYLQKHGTDRVCAVIVEPVQGEAGVILPQAGFLSGVGELCRKYGILIIADEIQTGLGRTGHYFASIAAGLEPDIITLAKPLGGGMLAIGATIARKHIYAKTLAGFSSKRHSNTFGGNSLSMAMGIKALELIIEGDLPNRAARMGTMAFERLYALKDRYPALLEDVRGAGLLIALQFRTVLPPKIVPGFEELIGELSGALGVRMLYEGGVVANFSLSSKRVARLTPALNMPDDIFERLLKSVEGSISSYKTANTMLRRMPLERLYRLGRLGLAK
ncbi:MAG: aspartate aminotransferase family protein [Deinococcales bacterium]